MDDRDVKRSWTDAQLKEYGNDAADDEEMRREMTEQCAAAAKQLKAHRGSFVLMMIEKTPTDKGAHIGIELISAIQAGGDEHGVIDTIRTHYECQGALRQSLNRALQSFPPGMIMEALMTVEAQMKGRDSKGGFDDA
jgi:hypothetical protein